MSFTPCNLTPICRHRRPGSGRSGTQGVSVSRPAYTARCSGISYSSNLSSAGSSCTVSMLPPHQIARWAQPFCQLPTCDSLTNGQIINLVSTSSQASPAGSDEGEEEEEDGDGMLQDERGEMSSRLRLLDANLQMHRPTLPPKGSAI